MTSQPTRWTLVRKALAGGRAEREEFAARYAPVIRTYLRTRWRAGRLADRVEDGVQQVFLECLEEDGALARVEEGRAGGFRGFLYGVARNVARNVERREARDPRQHGDSFPLEALESDDDSLALVFDRAWAASLLREAGERQLEAARARGADAVRRHRLLGLRYGQDLPVREIARSWDVDAAWLHGQFRQAREEFRRALEEVVRDHQGGGPESVDRECRRLLEHFS